MQKELIINELVGKVQSELDKVNGSYKTALNLVQSGDLKSDGKYDTRATEANYLADGLRQRISELEQELQLLEEVNINQTGEDVSIGSLVELRLNNDIKKYFIAPTAGGTIINCDGEAILVISVFSPIGNEALGLKVGDEFEIEINKSTREYQIVSIR